jgi:hypothetical protein
MALAAFFLALFLLSLSAAVSRADDSCVCNPADPFDPRSDAIMPAGPYKGQCQDSCVKRSMRPLTDDESRAYGGPTPGYVFAANTQIEGRFYVAKIPVNGVKDVIAQVEHFPPEAIAAHTQLRFQFKDRVELLPQAAGSKDPVVYTRDLVFSGEYAAPQHVPFDLVKGELNHFAINYRLMDLKFKYDYMVERQGHRVDQYRLKLSRGEKSGMLKGAFGIATKAGMHTMYNTLANSCTTEMFHVIDLGLDKRIHPGPGRLGRAEEAVALNRMPIWSPAGLRKRGIIDASSKLDDLKKIDVRTIVDASTDALKPVAPAGGVYDEGARQCLPAAPAAANVN